jgi:hypothetical protein
MRLWCRILPPELFCLLIDCAASSRRLLAGQLRIMPLLQHRLLLLGFKEQPQVSTAALLITSMCNDGAP